MKLSDKTKRLLSTLALVLVGVAIGYALFGGQGGSVAPSGGVTPTETVTPSENATPPGDVTPSESGSGAVDPGESQALPSDTVETAETVRSATSDDGKITVYEDRTYSSRDKVALYIHAFGHLPANYITKDEAEALGWTGGSLDPYAPGCSIGGDYFGNYQNLLPSKRGREWHECDIGTQGKSSRGAKRIVYSNDGLIYYTSDHYESFTQLY